MKRRWITAVLCYAGLMALAQLPIIPYLIPNAASVSITNFMPGLAEAWEWTNYPLTNAVMTNWVGKYGSILTNGDTTSRPTNTSVGVGFPQSVSVTIVGFTNSIPSSIPLGTNYIISLFISNVDTGNHAVRGIYNLCGTNGGAFWAESLILNGSNDRLYTRNSFGANDQADPVMVKSQYIDVSIFRSNSLNSGFASVVYYYTNGQFFRASSFVDRAPASPSFLSWGNNIGFPDSGFQGFIQGYYLITNSDPSTITPALFSNIHYYRTNYLMTGCSP
jgi:hypothetical protein